MNQGSLTSINWSMPSSFTGYVYNNEIFTYTGEKIGVNLAKYLEIENALKKCKDKLVELGEIKLPKTPEQIIQEQQELLEKQSAAINQLLEKINEPTKLEQVIKSSTAEYTAERTAGTSASSEDNRPVSDTDKKRRSKSLATASE